MRKALLLALAVLLITATAFAGDPPARVARLSYLTGEVSIQPGGVNDWVQANINRPLTSSDRVWADKDGRAELQMGGAALRLDNTTSLTLSNVSDNNVQLQLDQGTASLHVVELFDGEVYEVDTPNVAFIVRKAGDYRFDVDNAGDTTSVTVFRGEGDATGEGPAVRIRKEERYTFTGMRSLRFTMNHNPGMDGFDQWAFARAQREDRAVSARYVSRYAVGYPDLDDYGYWETVAPYGPIWYPRTVVVGWAPYRYGHWAYVGPWGWTWVDDAPWGFAPFHYGRWVYYGSRWGWCPGPYHVRPVYAPALVAWVGGPHWGVGLSFGIGGGVGWFPLGWGEPYIPYYGHSRHYFEHVNVTNTRITNITYVTNNYYGDHHGREWNYAYRNQERAVTAVSNDTFRMGRPTRDGWVKVPERELHDSRVERNVALRPTTNAVLGANAGEHRAVPPSTWGRRPPSGAVNNRVADAEMPRPDRVQRPNAGGPNTETGKPAWNNGRVNRSVPRPPERGNGTATAEAERPRDIPNPGRGPQSNGNSTGSMPNRVPHPPALGNRPDGVGRPTGVTPTNDGGQQAAQPSRNYGPDRMRSVPRPPEGQVARPDTHNDAINRRGDSGSSMNQNNGSRPDVHNNSVNRRMDGPPSQPARGNEGVSHDMRPAPPQRGERSAPRAEQSHPAPQQHASPPAARENKPPASERKVERLNDNPRSDVRYPRPYGNVEAASYTSYARPSYAASTRSDYPRPYESTVNTRTSARTADVWGSRSPSSSHSYRTESNYGQAARSYASSSYSAPQRYSSGPARSYGGYSSSGMSRGSYSGGSHSSGGSSQRASSGGGHSSVHASNGGGSSHGRRGR